MDLQSAMFGAVVSAAVDAIVVIDQKGRIVSLNPSAERMFGYSRDETVGQNVSMLMPEPDHSRHDGYIAAHRQTGKRKIIGIGREVTGKKKCGEHFPVHLSVGAFESEGVSGYVGILHDISIQKKTAQELQLQRDRLAQVTRLTTVGEMASGIAHEVNQPLSAIANYARALEIMIERGVDNPEKTTEIIGKIVRQAQRAGEVIRRVRGLSAQRETQRQSLDIDKLVEESLVLAETDARHHGHQIKTDLNAKGVTAFMDPVQFQQVLLNLIRNGLDAMSGAGVQSGTLSLRTYANDDQVVMEVEDQGCGISEEGESKLFTAFHTTKADGTGLGLAISRSIVEAEGGQLSFTRNEGAGVTFIVRLKREREGGV